MTFLIFRRLFSLVKQFTELVEPGEERKLELTAGCEANSHHTVRGGLVYKLKGG